MAQFVWYDIYRKIFTAQNNIPGGIAMAQKHMYRMTSEEVKELISHTAPEWNDFEKAKQFLYITVFDDKYIDRDRTNSIIFDKDQV